MRLKGQRRQGELELLNYVENKEPVNLDRRLKAKRTRVLYDLKLERLKDAFIFMLFISDSSIC